MRLLNVSSYQLETFIGIDKPQYAILSHTWELEGEVLFEDLQPRSVVDWRSKPGFLKVKNTCDRALLDGYNYVWIDTCCIDKSSSAELSEAINSMFRWYQNSSLCYAFLSDVADGKALFSTSRWFSRGWTLQELIAPDRVVFFNADWQHLGDRRTLADEITMATGIERHMLIRPDCKVQEILHGFSIAQRMNWASKRVTSRVEDIAYCLMGLFDVNMPLLYGEGDKAFRRLQEAIVNESADHSILAFRDPHPPGAGPEYYSAYSPVLAPEVRFFCDEIRHEWIQDSASQKVTALRLENGSVTLEVFLAQLRVANDGIVNPYAPSHVAFLDCVFGDDYLSRPAILLRQMYHNVPHVFRRCSALPTLLKATATSAPYVTVLDNDMAIESKSSEEPGNTKNI